ncbi:hypothetical protein FF38_01476 [Lucilia cuprina]|uniref:Retrotransposon gag domain-containing protein n=1 Tax=Lucilia cuprina TaxID=7375 RepID=A0A0L0C2T1_LUCCU|nr:hypothetical protein FF38_01476 [Lucilia cuprina]
MWNNKEKVVELILALKGNAAVVHESRMELRGRMQKANETLQDFALEIERLLQLAYPGEHHPFLDIFKIEAFVNGIRDPKLKHVTPKSSFAETVEVVAEIEGNTVTELKELKEDVFRGFKRETK